MKIKQSNTRMEIYSNGVGNIFAGLLFTVVGLYVTAAFYSGSTSLLPVLLGCVFAIIGLTLILLSKNKTITIDKEGTTTIIEHYLIIRRYKQQSIQTSDIASVNLFTYMQQNRDPNNNTRTRSSELSLLLKNNDLIQIANSNGMGFSMNGINLASLIMRSPLSKEANQIATFLGVPLKTNDNS